MYILTPLKKGLVSIICIYYYYYYIYIIYIYYYIYYINIIYIYILYIHNGYNDKAPDDKPDWANFTPIAVEFHL